jgi:hypothetical protein
VIGDDWPTLARTAALELSNGADHEDESHGVRLLADIRAVFDERGVDRLASAALADSLHKIEESPWAEWYGNVGSRAKPVQKTGTKSPQATPRRIIPRDGFGSTERRRSRTYPAWGCQTSPVFEDFRRNWCLQGKLCTRTACAPACAPVPDERDPRVECVPYATGMRDHATPGHDRVGAP